MGVVMSVRVNVRIRRHEYHVAMTDAALGDDVVGKRLHLGTATLEYGDFETAVMADVNMKRGLGEVVVIVEFLGQAPG